MDDFTYAALFWGLGGLVNGITGFGAALVAMPFITQLVDLNIAVPSCIIITLIMNIQIVWTYRRNADWKRLLPLLLGAVPGSIAGVTLLKHMPEYALKGCMGTFLLLYALWSLYGETMAGRERAKNRRPISSAWGLLAGFGSTAIGTTFGIGGPPIIVYTALAGWRKDEIKAGIGSFFAVAGLIMAGTQLFAGLYTRPTLTLFAMAAPAVFIGCFLGIRISRHIGEFSYRRILFIMLALMSLSIIRSGINAM